MLQAVFSIPGDHPCLPGHFPGNPVVPGVVILDAIFKCLLSEDDTMSIKAISNVKFLMPLRPDTKVTLSVTEKKPGTLQFGCSTTEGILANGLLRI